MTFILSFADRGLACVLGVGADIAGCLALLLAAGLAGRHLALGDPGEDLHSLLHRGAGVQLSTGPVRQSLHWPPPAPHSAHSSQRGRPPSSMVNTVHRGWE